jgi:hypothetical protein
MSARTYISTLTPAVTAGAYAAGDVFGGLLSFPISASEGGTLLALRIYDAGDVKPALKFYFFQSEPSEVLDNEVFATGISLADKKQIKFVVNIGSELYESIDGDAVMFRSGIGYTFTAPDDDRVLRFYAVTVGTPTPPATTDYTIEIEYERNT